MAQLSIEKFGLLKKLMDRSGDGSDAERLKAIDEANKLVKASGFTWSQILDRVVTVDVPIEAAAERSTEKASLAAVAAFRKKVAEAFETIEESDPRGDWADFVASLKDQWDRTQRLSQAQLEALFKGAENAEKKNGPRR